METSPNFWNGQGIGNQQSLLLSEVELMETDTIILNTERGEVEIASFIGSGINGNFVKGLWWAAQPQDRFFYRKWN